MSMQLDWRNCRNCQAMFFNGFPDKGRCPAGGGHDAAQSFNFVLPHDVPTVLDFDFNPIVFDGGVPVGGFAHLTIRQDGSFTFLGHFHDSGALEFNVALAWVVKDSQIWFTRSNTLAMWLVPSRPAREMTTGDSIHATITSRTIGRTWALVDRRLSRRKQT